MALPIDSQPLPASSFLFMPPLVPISMPLEALRMPVIMSVALVAVVIIIAIGLSPIISRIVVSNHASTQKNQDQPDKNCFHVLLLCTLIPMAIAIYIQLRSREIPPSGNKA
jgi:hypothetical protein